LELDSNKPQGDGGENFFGANLWFISEDIPYNSYLGGAILLTG